MFQCKLCSHSSESLKAFLLHFHFHRNVANFRFPCGVPECTRTFRTHANFKSHIYRDHRRQLTRAKFRNVEAILTCQIPSCSEKCRELVQFLAHLRSHLQDGIPVACPFKDCEKIFCKKSSFSSHLSRKHKNWSLSLLSGTVSGTDSCEQNTFEDHNDTSVPDDSCSGDEDAVECIEGGLITSVDQEQYLNSLALFYLKLQAKFLLPSSVIQNVIEEFQEIHNLGQTHLFSTLRQKLVSLDVQDCDVKKLLGELSQEDLLRACNTGALRSDKSRKSFFKSHFNFVEPVELYLGTDDNSRARYCQYVPVHNTLKALFKNECVRRQYEQIH